MVGRRLGIGTGGVVVAALLCSGSLGAQEVQLLAGGDIEWSRLPYRPTVAYLSEPGDWMPVPYLNLAENLDSIRVRLGRRELDETYRELHYRVPQPGFEFATEEEEWRHSFQRTRDLIESADVAFANLEMPISERAQVQQTSSVGATGFADALGWAGFDVISIDTPGRIVGVEAVARLDGTDLDLTVTSQDERGFSSRIPRIGSNHNGMLIELTFQAQVYDYSTPFTARLSDSDVPFEVPQPVSEGDADELNDSNRTRVALTTIPDQSIRSLRLSSPVFSPNGDRVNDVLQIDYELMNLSGAVPVSIAVYDLTGRQVGGVGPGGSAVSGPSSVSWDGTGDQGRLAPGLYLLQLEVETDTGRDRAQRLVAIAY